ncbi:hypothetical protein FB107DRAFT_258536, partial [Schizophyllum commune]
FVTSPSSLPQLVMSRWINPTDVHEILHCAPRWLDGKSPALALRTSTLRAAVGIAWLEDRRMTGNQAAERGLCLPPMQGRVGPGCVVPDGADACGHKSV